eukprot:SAG31_NODE_7371_length_1707_cov_2.520522_1_plen_75_part_00
MPNSQVVHAVSDSLSQPFRRKEVVFPAFAHEPTVARAPSGEFVMYFTGAAFGAAAWRAYQPFGQQICNCSTNAR